MALPRGPVWIAVSSTSLSVVNSGVPSFPRGQGAHQFMLMTSKWPSLWTAPGYPEVTQVKPHTSWKNPSLWRLSAEPLKASNRSSTRRGSLLL